MVNRSNGQMLEMGFFFLQKSLFADQICNINIEHEFDYRGHDITIQKTDLFNFSFINSCLFDL